MPNFGLYKPPSANYVEEYQLAAFHVANMPAFDTREKRALHWPFCFYLRFGKYFCTGLSPKVRMAMKAFYLQAHLNNTMQDNRRAPACGSCVATTPGRS